MTASAYGFALPGLPASRWIAEAPPGTRLPVLDVTSLDAVADELAVHPGLSAVALPAALALGRTSLHAGAILLDDLAWALVGTKETGKSTLVAACHAAGVGVLTDDALILDGRTAFAGPRCADLRDPAPGSTPVREGRHRVTLGAVPASAELAGCVFLDWGDDPAPALSPIQPAERLARLADPSRGDAPWRGTTELLDLAELPGFVLRRRRDGDVRDAVVALRDGLRAGAVR